MAIVYAVPFVPPAPPKPWVGLNMTWTGWDGSLWNLAAASEGVVMLPGVRGLTMPPIVHYTTAYPTVAGARWRGHAVDPREVFWPIQIFHDLGSQEWITRDRAFWRTLRPDKTGTWTVTQPSGEARTLTCRFDNDGESAFATDPVLAGWTNYGITLKANAPFWRGDPITREWIAGVAQPFFPAAGPGGKLTISSSRGLGSASIRNPGDVEAFPRWELDGPITAASISIGGKAISIPFSIATGQVLVIDADPAVQSAVLYNASGSGVHRVLSNPVDKTMQLGSVNFAAIPAEAVTPIGLTMTGSGKVTLKLTPLYLRAW